jgi:hypothetical protein
MADVNKEIAIKVTATDASGPALQSLEDKLNAAKKRMIELAVAGKQNTEEFIRLQQEAGEFKRTIEGVEQSVDSVAKSGTQGMQLFSEALTAVTAGFTIATSMSALYGEENEDLQKTMMKVQASMALLQSIQALLAITTKTSAVATTANRIALALYDKTLKGTIVSLRLFRTALISTGIGAAIVGVGLLVENWEKLTKAVKDFLGIETKDLKAVSELAQRQVELAEARGESEAKVQKLLMAAYDARIAAAEKEEERAQLIHEKEVARLTYQTKLRTDAIEKQKKDAEDLRAMDSAASQEAENFRLAKIGRINDELAREKALRDEKLAILREEKAQREADLKKRFTDSDEFAKAYILLTEEMRLKEQGIAEDSAAKIGEIERKRRQQDLEMASNAVGALGDLLTAGLGKSEKDQRKAFEINKKASMGQALINTFMAVTAALTAGGNPIKLATGRQFVDAGIALAAGLAQVAKISKTQFQGSSASGGGGALTAGGGEGGEVAPPPIFANPQMTMLGTDGAAMGQGQGSSPMRAYVVERDITQSTRRVRRLEEFATLGA